MSDTPVTSPAEAVAALEYLVDLLDRPLGQPDELIAGAGARRVTFDMTWPDQLSDLAGRTAGRLGQLYGRPSRSVW